MTRLQYELPEVNESYRAEYVQFLLEAVPDISLDNRKVVIDCANGAASSVAPQLFAELQGTVEVTHASPDGRNINDELRCAASGDCGGRGEGARSFDGLYV